MSKVRMFIACDDAQMCCDKAQYNEATLLEKVKLTIHLMFCRACQVYTKNNNKLTKLMDDDKLTNFNSSEKSALENAFKEQLKNSQQ